MTATAQLPAITVLIEWENAIDVEDRWTARAMKGLARELAACSARMPQKPRVMYLYDRHAVEPGTVERAIEQTAPELKTIADLEIIPTEKLTYYKLKNFGVARSRTELTVMVDSDAEPQPGWLDALLEPFADPEVVAVGGFTRLGYDDFLSRAMALTWIFDLPGQEAKTERRNSIHVNNCAVRTDFFRAHPFPDLPTFKVSCVFWLRGVKAEGHRFVRSAKAQAVHAPHPGMGFVMWRAWTAGLDADYLTCQTISRSHLARFGYSFFRLGKNLVRDVKRVVGKAGVVGMPVWQRPFALLIAFAYHLVLFVSQARCALTKRYGPVPPFRPMEPALT